MKNNFGGSLRSLIYQRKGKSLRESSYDRTGGNEDWIIVPPNSTKTIFNISGSGCINHIWMTTASRSKMFLRKALIKMYWEDQKKPSVLAPLGDFFGMGHGKTRNFVSAPLQMAPQGGRSLVSYFQMPFNKKAVIEIENQSETDLRVYYYVDYEAYDEPQENILYFHSQWRREITKGIEDNIDNMDFQFNIGKNTTGEDNYVILEAEGKGHYVGCNLNIHNLRKAGFLTWDWYGEGDDMIFIDGESWPPSIHGTGTEDYFNTAFCPDEIYNGPYSGMILNGDGRNWVGKVTYYRYHITDPIMFNKSIKVTVEHGHNNHRSDDYSSTAYWYQTLPHKPFGILPVEERIPFPDEEEMSELEL